MRRATASDETEQLRLALRQNVLSTSRFVAGLTGAAFIVRVLVPQMPLRDAVLILILMWGWGLAWSGMAWAVWNRTTNEGYREKIRNWYGLVPPDDSID